jgi:hypothetical protein
LVRYLDLATVMLACAAVALAAGGPFIPGTPDSIRDLVLVLDGGVEMAAGERAEKLRKVAGAEIVRRAEGTKMVILCVCEGGAQVWSGTETDDAHATIQAHNPGWLQVSSDDALALGREAGRTLADPDFVFCTYRPGRPEGYRLRTVTGEVPNAGVESMEVILDPEGGGRIARLGLRGRGKVEIEGHWSGEVDGTTVVDVALPPGGRVELKASFAGDRFAPDDSVYLIVPERKVPRVLVVAEAEPSPFLSAALQALETTLVIRGPLDRTTPDRAGEAARAQYDLLVFDRCVPPERLTGTRALYIAPPPGALPFKVGEWTAAPAVFDVQKDHFLVAGFDFTRVVPVKARAIWGGEAIAHAAPGPLLAATRSWVALGFDPDRCVFAATPSYPLFLRNAIAHLVQMLPQPAPEFFAVGEDAPGEGIARIEDKGQVRVEDRLIGPPGFWELGEQSFAVNFLEPGLDLASASAASDPLPEVGEKGEPDQPLAAQFSAAALFLLLVAWWVFWRRWR